MKKFIRSLDRPIQVTRRGTTLLEVFMVLVILTGTLSIIGVGSAFKSRTSIRQDSDEVVNAIRLARETAIASGCDVVVRHVQRKHPSTGQACDAIEMIATKSPYQDVADAQGVGHFGAMSPETNQWMVDPIWMAESTKIKTDSREIKFDANGSASQDTVWIIQQTTDSLKISVEAVSGNIFRGA